MSFVVEEINCSLEIILWEKEIRQQKPFMIIS